MASQTQSQSGSGSPDPSQDPDLFGPDPAQDPMAWYAPGSAGGDLYASAPPDVAGAWRRFVGGLARLPGGMTQAKEWTDRQVNDLGLAYRVTGDVEERAWSLSPMSLSVPAGVSTWLKPVMGNLPFG